MLPIASVQAISLLEVILVSFSSESLCSKGSNRTVQFT